MRHIAVLLAVLPICLISAAKSVEAAPPAAGNPDAGTGAAPAAPALLAFPPLRKGEHLVVSEELSIQTQSTPKVGTNSPPATSSSVTNISQDFDVTDAKNGVTSLSTIGPLLEGLKAPSDAKTVTFNLKADGSVGVSHDADADTRELAELSAKLIRRIRVAPTMFQNGDGSLVAVAFAIAKDLLVAGYEVPDGGATPNGSWSLVRKPAVSEDENYDLTVTGCTGPIKSWTGHVVIGPGFNHLDVDLRGSGKAVAAPVTGLDDAKTDVSVTISSKRRLARQSGSPEDRGNNQ